MTRSIVTPRTRTTEVGLEYSGIYRAKLAEDYDGVGQYVMVAHSGATVGSGYKARVASGDFGGGRTFPAGTPVWVHSNRGQIEVFLGNHPKGCTIIFPHETAPGEGWGEVVGTTTDPDEAEWNNGLPGCSPGDDWYHQSNPYQLYSTGGAAILDLTEDYGSFPDESTDPGSTMHFGGDGVNWKAGPNVGDYIDILIKMKLEMSIDNPTTANPQIDFWFMSDDRDGSIGPVGDGFGVSFAGLRQEGAAASAPRTPGMWVVLSRNLSMGYPPLDFETFGDYYEYVAPAGDHSLWNTDIFIRMRIARNANGNVDLRSRMWRADADEPADDVWFAAWDEIIDHNWRGLRTIRIRAYYANTYTPTFPRPHLPTKYYIYSIEDTSGLMCTLSDDRELDPCNGV